MVNKGIDILAYLHGLEDAWNRYEHQPEIGDILINPTERANEIREWQQ